MQPENICTLNIDVQFDKPELITNFFNHIDNSCLKFNTGTDGLAKSIQRITNSLEFYETYFKKYIDELDKILKEQYKDFFTKMTQAQPQPESNAVDPTNGQLNNHQKFFNLVINKKVVYAQIRIEDVINATQKQFKSRMFVVLKYFD